MEPGTTLDALRQELSGRGTSLTTAAGSDGAFRQLFNAVISLELQPGRLVSERQLMELADCSRSALRPAVIRLEELGLLRSLPRKGLVVAPLEAMEAAALYEAREAIETRVLRLAAERARDQHLQLLDELVASWDQTVENAWSWRTFMERDQEFHLALASMAGNPYLYDALTRLMPLAARLWNWVYSELGTDTHIRFHHEDIIEAVRAGDPDAAEQAVTEHIDRSRTRLSEFFVARWHGGHA
jgi:DNA-binding GntR family transcriptional regulator